MVSDSPDLQKPVLGLISCTCDVPVWGILLIGVFVLCLVVFLFMATRNCRRAMADCSWARAQADTDDLTGLWSRHAINRRLQEGQCHQDVDGPLWSVVFIDVNGLKSINDNCGHLVGDCVLKVFAQGLSHSIRFSDYAGRWGGDEFVVLVSGMRSNADIENFCHKLQQETSKAITVDGNEIKISASFGYALARVDGESINDLIKVADSRMYMNKHEDCKN
ncbi:GGDEF domain-containing protein [Desulfovibrio sp. QI0430]